MFGDRDGWMDRGDRVTLSAMQVTSVQSQSLVTEEVMYPGGQVRVELWQLQVHP